jgi:hypothetical protein
MKKNKGISKLKPKPKPKPKAKILSKKIVFKGDTKQIILDVQTLFVLRDFEIHQQYKKSHIETKIFQNEQVLKTSPYKICGIHTHDTEVLGDSLCEIIAKEIFPNIIISKVDTVYTQVKRDGKFYGVTTVVNVYISNSLQYKRCKKITLSLLE